MISKKSFGNTSHKSTCTIFGAFALSEANEKLTDQIMNTVVEYGINHIDTAASYGKSEQMLGPWLQTRRNDFFLATKTEKRTYKEAKEELHKSLELLHTDHVDLWQMHNLVNTEQWETALSEGGVIEAFIEAKEQGLVKYLGVTGHGLAAPKMHLKSLKTFNFDSVLVPYNYVLMQDAEYAANYNALEKHCVNNNIALQTIKSLAIGQLQKSPTDFNVWYNPLKTQEDVNIAVRWVLANENVFLNTSGDFNLLKMILKAANTLKQKPSDVEMQSLIKKNNMTSLFTGDEI